MLSTPFRKELRVSGLKVCLRRILYLGSVLDSRCLWIRIAVFIASVTRLNNDLRAWKFQRLFSAADTGGNRAIRQRQLPVATNAIRGILQPPTAL